MLSIYTLNESEVWDSKVKSFPQYDIYYLSGYSKAFQLHGDGEPLLFFYEKDNFKAINVVMKRDIAISKEFKNKIQIDSFFDLSTPYGYGGFIYDGEITEENLNDLNQSYIEYCKNNCIISEFVRFHPILQNNENNQVLYDIIKLGKTIMIDLNTKDLIWDNLTSKNRNMIRKATKSGVKVFWSRSIEIIAHFIDMYNVTMDNDEADEYYYFKNKFYKSILNDLKYNSMIFYATLNNEIISMSIILFENNQIHYHLSASDISYRSYAATNLLLYEVACWGTENGYKTMHLGGGLGSKEDGLYKFKKAFNKNSDICFSIGKKIFDKDKYNKLVEIRVKDNEIKNENYFPLYRG